MINLTTAQLPDTHPVTSLDAVLRALFGPHIGIGQTDPGDVQPALYPAEAACVTGCVPKRQIEFAAGRAAARRAMEDIGLRSGAVLRAEDRAPVWPRGMIGSISHTESACVAAVAEAGALRSIGLDIEDSTALDTALLPEICTLAERAWLAIQPEQTRGILAKLIFSAKECAYKCQYPVTGQLFDFHALEITPDLDTGQFEATFTRDVGPFTAGTCFHGRFAIHEDLIVTTTLLARSPRWTMRGQ